ncbi:hypothetical protein KDX40_04930 [Burkholderia ambifaria]|uniref:hypothetical protein n=1 Tax=Burkholderia ambifaria TaxID=152480 RepID=UPI001B940AD5|nr:hypothetical protein [Burkholderia ambifaria]MBR8343082.1 hypothetical protein [Burkholderia ambifaria]
MSAFDDYLNAAPAQGPGQSFDSYIGAAPASSAAVPPALRAPQKSRAPGMLESGVIGFGKGVGSTASGIEQLAGKGIGAIGNLFAPAPNLSGVVTGQQPQNWLQRAGNFLSNDAAANLNELKQGAAPAEAAHPFATGAGNVAGQILATAPTLALGPEYAGLGLAGKIGLGAAQGAAGAAAMPVENPNSGFWAQKAGQMGVGAGLGAATPLVAAGAGALGRGLWNVAQPVLQPGRFVGQGLAGAMDPAEAAAAAANIRGAQQFVPGSMPTTAQIAQTPVMVQTEKAAANMPAVKTAMAQRAIDNNNARWQALMGVAQDPAALQAAQDARAAASGPLYDAAHSATANIGPGFMRKAQIPEMQQAMQQAEDLARLQAQTGRGIPAVWPQAPTPGVARSGSKAINGAALDYTSRALRDMSNEAAPQKAAALSSLRDWVDSWAGQYVPGVQQARQMYAQMSVPVNTMEVGQQIANGLGTRAMNAGGVPEIQLMPFRSALTSAMNKGDAAKYGIDANALQALQGIGQDLQRATVSNSIRSPGSDTAYNLAANGWLARQLYGPTFGGAGNLGKAVGALGATALGHPMAGLGILGAGNKIGQMVGSRLQDRLSGLLMDPNTVLPYLDARAAAAAQPVPGALMQGLLNYGRPAAVNGLLGGFNNPGNK